MYLDRLKPVQVWLVGDTVVDRQTRNRPDRSSLAVAKEKRKVASLVFAELHADMEKLGIRHIGRPLSMGSFPLLPECIIIIRDRGCAGCTHYPRLKQPKAGVHPCAGRCGAGSQWPDRGTTRLL